MLSIIIVLVFLCVMTEAKHIIARDMNVLDYDKRWANGKYIEMIHRTRLAEKTLGIELTLCECPAHAAVADMREIKHIPKHIPTPKTPKPQVSWTDTGNLRVFKVSSELFYGRNNASVWSGQIPKYFMGLQILDWNEDSWHTITVRCINPELIKASDIVTGAIITRNQTYSTGPR